MKVLITGGLGFIGHSIVQKLVHQGHEVHALGRTAYPSKDKLIPGLQYHVHDLSQSVLSPDWLMGTETIFHVAAKAGVGGKYADYFHANVLSTENLLHAAKQCGVRRFIYTSTPSVVFAKSSICNGNESLPYSTENFSPYATTKALAEKCVLDADDPSGMRTIALRPHLVWGSGDPHLLPRVIARHRAGKFKIVGDGTNKVDLTHIENVVHAHLCAFDAMIADASLGGRKYFIGQEEPVPLWPWLNQIFLEIGLPTLDRSISFKTAYHLGQGIEKIWDIFRLKKDPPMTRFIACQLAQDHWFSSQAARNDLNYRPIISMSQAMEKTLPWLRQLSP